MLTNCFPRFLFFVIFAIILCTKNPKSWKICKPILKSATNCSLLRLHSNHHSSGVNILFFFPYKVLYYIQTMGILQCLSINVCQITSSQYFTKSFIFSTRLKFSFSSSCFMIMTEMGNITTIINATTVITATTTTTTIIASTWTRWTSLYGRSRVVLWTWESWNTVGSSPRRKTRPSC